MHTAGLNGALNGSGGGGGVRDEPEVEADPGQLLEEWLGELSILTEVSCLSSPFCAKISLSVCVGIFIFLMQLNVFMCV